MQSLQARGAQYFFSGRRCQTQRRRHHAFQTSWSRAKSGTVTAASSSVPVAISIKCKVDFGESLRLVGNQPFLGSWDPTKGAEMSWNDGNVWKVDAKVPVGTEIDFKVVKFKSGGAPVEWEGGDNRTFKVLGPDYGLHVTCHWSKSQDMKVAAYRLDQQQQQQQQQGAAAPAAAVLAAVAGSNGAGVDGARPQPPQTAPAGSQESVDGGAAGGSLGSYDGGASSHVNGSARSALSMSRSSLEDESAARGAWVGAEPEFVRSRRKDEGGPRGTWQLEGLQGVALELVRGDKEAPSWLKKLALEKKLLVDEAPALRPRLEELSYLYIYATWVNTGALPCAESGSHYRPNHHANLALQMFRSLEWVIGDATRGGGPRSPLAERLILAARRMHTRLPAFSGEFRQSTPLTRIRDIAHRNDIPKDIKDEIKHTIQNKLHRSAGPEDLIATEAMLQRITAVPGQYSAAFVEEFKIFTRELREFFNASGLVELLNSTLDTLDDAHLSAVRQLLSSKERLEERGGAARLDELMGLLTAATQARSFYASGLVAGLRNDVTDDVLSMRQRWRLADIRLEEYAFVVLSRIIGMLEELGAPHKLPKAPNSQWALPLAALTFGLRNMGLSLYDTRELMALENELQRWHSTSPLVETRDAALRGKASLERALRVASEYSDSITDVYGQPAALLGRALGLPEHMGAIFAEAEVRASMAFQVSKLAAMLARALRAAAGQEPWDVLVPGEATGVLREVPSLDAAALGAAGGPSEGEVLVVRRADGDEELGPLGSRLRGVVLLQELPHLSHLGVRARQEKVPFATCDDEDTAARVLRPLLGRRVTLTAAGDCTVTVREATAAAAAAPAAPAAATNGAKPRPAALATPTPSGSGAAGAAIAAAAKAGRWREVVVPLERAISATCGAKAEKCSALAALAAQSGGLFAAPRGAVVPYGCLEAAAAAAGRDDELAALVGRLEDPRVGSGPELDAACTAVRDLVLGLKAPAGMVEQVVATITDGASSTSSSSPAFSSPLLAVRSSANVEDLAGMSAAGLYDSVVGVPSDDPVSMAAAVAEVWASLYSRRAVLSRRSAGVPQSSARMAVLVMELVAPDLSFVLHTARPRDGNAEILLAEVAPGQGETLAAGTRGSPWRFEVVKASGAVTTQAFANFSTALMLPSQAKPVAPFASYGSGAATAVLGTTATATAAATSARRGVLVPRDVDYSAQRMSVDSDWRTATVRQLEAVGSYIEKAMDGVPQDIEGGVVVGPEGAAQVHIFQTRPQ